MTIPEATSLILMEFSQRRRVKENVMPMMIVCLYLIPHLDGARCINLAPNDELLRHPPLLLEKFWMVTLYKKSGVLSRSIISFS